MNCKNCGAQLDDDALYCGRCGTAVVRENADQPDDSSEKLSLFKRLLLFFKKRPYFGCFILGAGFFVASVVKFVTRYIKENKVYQILVESMKDFPGALEMLGFGTPASYAWSAVLKSPYIYLAVLCLGVGFAWWYKNK